MKRECPRRTGGVKYVSMGGEGKKGGKWTGSKPRKRAKKTADKTRE